MNIRWWLTAIVGLISCMMMTMGLMASEGTPPPREKLSDLDTTTTEQSLSSDDTSITSSEWFYTSSEDFYSSEDTSTTSSEWLYSTSDESFSSSERCCTAAEWVSMDEKRSQFVSQEKEKSVASSEETSSVSEEVESGAHSWNLHNDCRHRVISVADNLSALRLEDGSLWKVSYFDRRTIGHWFMEHHLYITQNPYSSYHFRIVNLDTNESVEANCAKKGVFMNPFIRIIDAISYDGIKLNDGTIWKVDNFESNFLGNWLLGDTVIVGVNTGFSGYFSPYIIYNYNTSSYIIVNLY